MVRSMAAIHKSPSTALPTAENCFSFTPFKNAPTVLQQIAVATPSIIANVTVSSTGFHQIIWHAFGIRIYCHS